MSPVNVNQNWDHFSSAYLGAKSVARPTLKIACLGHIGYNMFNGLTAIAVQYMVFMCFVKDSIFEVTWWFDTYLKLKMAQKL